MPKPMVPIGEKPILWHIMKTFNPYSFNEFVLLLGHKGEVIREFILNFFANTMDVTIDHRQQDTRRLTFHGTPGAPRKVTLVDTGMNALTGARFWRAQRFLGNDPAYGLGCVDIDSERCIAR